MQMMSQANQCKCFSSCDLFMDLVCGHFLNLEFICHASQGPGLQDKQFVSSHLIGKSLLSHKVGTSFSPSPSKDQKEDWLAQGIHGCIRDSPSLQSILTTTTLRGRQRVCALARQPLHYLQYRASVFSHAGWWTCFRDGVQHYGQLLNLSIKLKRKAAEQEEFPTQHPVRWRGVGWGEQWVLFAKTNTITAEEAVTPTPKPPRGPVPPIFGQLLAGLPVGACPGLPSLVLFSSPSVQHSPDAPCYVFAFPQCSQLETCLCSQGHSQRTSDSKGDPPEQALNNQINENEALPYPNEVHGNGCKAVPPTYWRNATSQSPTYDEYDGVQDLNSSANGRWIP
ncbi:Ribosomal RNA small subunit methyltransferase G, partial [Varanus komodoensis]